MSANRFGIQYADKNKTKNYIHFILIFALRFIDLFKIEQRSTTVTIFVSHIISV